MMVGGIRGILWKWDFGMGGGRWVVLGWVVLGSVG